jgi:N-acylneuraminate cytidylyltransferase
MLNKNNFYKRSQDFVETYHDAGQFSWGTYDAWMNNKFNFNKKSKFYLLPKLRVQDIDTHEDFEIAKKLYKLLNRNYK